MKRTINIYPRKEITSEKIAKIKEIATNKYPQAIYQEYFDYLTNEKDILNECGPDTFLVLGEDWFLLYEETEDEVTFMEWIAQDQPENKMQQTIEMLTTFKQILLQNYEKEFIALMRHDTSYQFYQQMLKKEYCYQEYHQCSIDIAHPEEMEEILSETPTIPEVISLLENNDSKLPKQYLTYIVHKIIFNVSEKFINKYEKKRT